MRTLAMTQAFIGGVSSAVENLTELTRTEELMSSFFTEEAFRPAEPRNLEEAGLTESLVEALILKNLANVGSLSGRGIAEQLCLPFGSIESVLGALRTRQLIV